MSERPGPTPLRQLALDYAEGRIERAAYVQARSELLDALSAARPLARATQTHASSAATTQQMVFPRPPAALAPAAPPAPAKRSTRLALLGAGLMLPLAGGLWYGLFGGTEPQAPVTPPALGSTPPAPVPADTRTPEPGLPGRPPEAPALAAPPAAVGLVEELMREERLGASQRARFLAAWREQTPADQALARESYAFRSLEEELGTLIEAERVAADGQAEAQGLLAFGRALGIDLPDLPPAPQQQPAPAATPNRTLAEGSAGASPAAASPPAADPGAAPAKQPQSTVAAPAKPIARPSDTPSAPTATVASTVAPASASASASAPASASASAPPPAPASAPTPAAAFTAATGEGAGPAQKPTAPAKGVAAPPAPGPEVAKEAPKAAPAAAAEPAKAQPPQPSLAERLPMHPGGDPCASAARTAQSPVYDCLDRIASSAMELKVIPADTPFVITARTYNPNDWCSHQPSQKCPPTADADTKTRIYLEWLAGKTGRTYRQANAADLEQATSYGLRTPQGGQGIRLVRELGLPKFPTETQALERWWRRYRQTP